MDDPQEPLLPPHRPVPHSYDAAAQRDHRTTKATETMSAKSQWLVLAVASGACAAFNGVFAKLTTTELTSSWAAAIAGLLGLGKESRVVEFVIRAMFFGLNLVFNGIMWALFTTALARGTSTTQVSIINTSSNFMVTALMGFIVFAESLPPLWWLGAALLVAGSVIIGRRDDEDKGKEGRGPGPSEISAEHGEGTFREEGQRLLSEEVELEGETKDVPSVQVQSFE
ncbi:MAG: hypothetical protein M1827_002450 [Pycnora praestabilis]|nr:MAG: hypothetical protein M1827_002450 [Pycnora praestabilis]